MDGRTDLAMEAYALWKQDAQDTTQLPGVKAREEDAGGVHITRVDILDERGAGGARQAGRALCDARTARAGKKRGRKLRTGGAGNRARGVGVSAQPRKRALRGARQRRDYAGRLRSLGAGEHSCDAAYEAAPAGGVFRLFAACRRSSRAFWERAAWRRSSWCVLQRIFYSRRQLSRSTRWRQWTRQDFVQLSN